MKSLGSHSVMSQKMADLVLVSMAVGADPYYSEGVLKGFE